MADTVTSITLIDAPTVIVVHFTNKSDGTGESAVKKVDIAAINKNYFNVKPAGLRIEQARWAIQGFTDVQILWDRTAQSYQAMILTGSGYEDFRGLVDKASGVGGVGDYAKIGGLADPSEGNADGKGSILITTDGATNGASYDITLWLRKAPNQS